MLRNSIGFTASNVPTFLVPGIFHAQTSASGIVTALGLSFVGSACAPLRNRIVVASPAAIEMRYMANPLDLRFTVTLFAADGEHISSYLNRPTTK